MEAAIRGSHLPKPINVILDIGRQRFNMRLLAAIYGVAS
jgi:hypothetical protein